jgi:hypothetical protein
MNSEKDLNGADAAADSAIIRVKMKPFEYAAEFQYLEDAAASEAETLPNAPDAGVQAPAGSPPAAG